MSALRFSLVDSIRQTETDILNSAESNVDQDYEMIIKTVMASLITSVYLFTVCFTDSFIYKNGRMTIFLVQWNRLMHGKMCSYLYDHSISYCIISFSAPNIQFCVAKLSFQLTHTANRKQLRFPLQQFMGGEEYPVRDGFPTCLMANNLKKQNKASSLFFIRNRK